jgi:hypothetical protein
MEIDDCGCETICEQAERGLREILEQDQADADLSEQTLQTISE